MELTKAISVFIELCMTLVIMTFPFAQKKGG